MSRNTTSTLQIFAFVGMLLAGSGIILLSEYAGIGKIHVSDGPIVEEVVPDSITRFSFLVAGDAMAHLPQTAAALNKNTNTYAYDSVFQYIRDHIRRFDLAMINLETTLGGKPYRGYPMFSAPDAYAAGLSDAGFNLFCLANNHAVDRFNRGVIRTLHALDSMDIKHTGTFHDTLHRDTTYPLLLNIQGVKIAILNATYGTNGLFPKPPVMVNMIDEQQMDHDIARARGMNPDLIVAVMHWGPEYRRTPDRFQRSTAEFLAIRGVDVIVGHHPHVLQPVEWITVSNDTLETEALVIWSLGNFYSNQRQRYRDGAMFVTFNVAKNIHTGQTAIENLNYQPFWVWKRETPVTYRIFPKQTTDSLMNKYQLSAAQRKEGERFFNDTREHMTAFPHGNRLIHKQGSYSNKSQSSP
jgi:poly-gamma-glutamate capsule biosynthesis protein CapA/YwtB (metallophosphatase superfamily)